MKHVNNMNLTYKEMAEADGVTPEATRSRFRRVMRRIAKGVLKLEHIYPSATIIKTLSSNKYFEEIVFEAFCRNVEASAERELERKELFN